MISASPASSSAPTGLSAQPRMPAFRALARKWNLSVQHPSGFGNPLNCPLRLRETPYTTRSGLPLSISELTASLLPSKGEYPQLHGRGYHSFPDSSRDISISHLGVSRGHHNIPHTSHCTSKATIDSSGLRRLPSRTLRRYIMYSSHRCRNRQTITPIHALLASYGNLYTSSGPI